MKKKILLITSLFLLIMFTGCGRTAVLTQDGDYNVSAEDDRFMKVSSLDGWIYVDKETKVQYLFIKRMNAGGLTLLTDTDGKPLLYGGYIK